ncbi:MAG: DegV family protein [Lachnospiraceae bacterium]|jgi:DegV family protein with EDD domain|nr:DegV family protein [Lachnospiraceae bacterium]
MSYRIVLDSCGDLTPELKKDPNYESVPLELEINGERIIDDETFDQLSYIKKVAESPTCAKTSCPSPERYLESYKADVDHVYVVTLSGALSGSYNSAEVARKMYEEQYGPGKVHVFDSKSACCGETLIGRKIEEFEKSGMSFEEVVEAGEKFVKSVDTHFVLDDLETLRKNGRLSSVKALVASTLNIKPVMGAIDGVIVQRGKAVGLKKAYRKMIENLMEDKKGVNTKERSLMITHVNCPDRAQLVKEMLLEQLEFRDITIVDAMGVATTYANNGGIVVTV